MMRLAAAVLFGVTVTAAPAAHAGCCQTQDTTYPCFNADPPDQSYCEGSMWRGTLILDCSCNAELNPRRCVPNPGVASCSTSSAPTTTTTIDLCHALLLSCGPIVITTSNPLLLLNAPLPGRILAQVATTLGARLAQAKATVLARGKVKVRTAGPLQLTLKLTKKGKRLLRTTPTATADLTFRLTPKGGGTPTTETRAVTMQP
jgi:hypothetical protein